MGGDVHVYSREVVKSSWLNHSAFVYLCAGYVVSVFGEALPNKLFAFGAIVVLTAIISLVTIFIAKNLSRFPRTIRI